jgi:hypothetical protein
VRNEEDVEKLKRIAGDSLDYFDEIFVLPYDEKILLTEPDVTPLLQEDSPYVEAVRKMVGILERYGVES